MLALITCPAADLFAEAGPTTASFEVDGDFGSSITNGQITDDGLTTAYSEQGSGHDWIHVTDPVPYMGTYCYESWCSDSPDLINNDRTEHKILTGWKMSDGARYFSLAFYVPEETDNTDNWLLFCQWWQCDSYGPPLQLSLDGDQKILLTRKYDSSPGQQDVNTLCSFGTVQKDKWYHFLFAVQFDNNPSDGLTGIVSAYLMNPETGVFERKYHNTSLQLGWRYLPDGQTPAPTTNFVWKIGTYRGPVYNDTWVYYDNCRYGKTWANVTKNSLTGYPQKVLKLKFNQSSGSTAADDSNFANPGTLVNGPVWSAGGISGNCLYFDGTNDHVRTMDTTDFDTGNYLTVSAWFNTTYSQTSKAIVNMDGSTNFRLHIGNATQTSFFVYYPDGGHDSATVSDAGMNLFDGNWHHLVGVYNRFDSDKRIRLYLDGVEEANNVGTSKPLKRGSSYLYIGRYGNSYFKGYIDQVTMCNYPMTADEVEALHLNP